MRTIHPSTATPGRVPDDPPSVYAAGKVVAVVLLALLFAALLDADSLFASVSSEKFGTARSIELGIVRPVRAVSDAVGLNLPHRWLADIGGTNQPHLVDQFASPVEVAGTDGAIRDLLQPGVRTTPGRSAKPGRAVHPTPPRPRAISAASPLKMWIAGDSLIGAISDALVGHVVGNPAVQATTDIQIGTGLARPDVYDWPGAVALEMQKQPNLVVVTFGANDAQDMVAGSTYLVRNTPAWQAEYARRVGLIMSEVAAPGRMLIWLEVPPVARPRLQQTSQITNAIVRAQARLHPGVVVVDPGPVLTTNGAYTMYLPGPSGQPIQVRDTDGIHLTPAGADRVLPLILAAIRQEWQLP